MKEIVFSVLLVLVSNNILSQYRGGSGRGDAVVRSTTTTLNGYLPTINSFTPSTVCVSSGNQVIITGTNFTGTTSVSFGGTLATAFTVNSANQITATVGAGTTGTISVTTLAGTVISAGILTVDPNCTTTKAIFDYTGSNQTFTVPNCGVTSIKVKTWGAGGGSGDNSSGGNGGGGAYVTGTIPVTPGQQLTIIVGQGGARGAVNTTGGYSMSAAFGGGGRGRDEDRGGGGGGGRSAIRLTDGTEVATAAGGGGGGGSGTSTGNGSRYCGGGGGALGGTGGRGGDRTGCGTTGGCGGSSTIGGGCTNAVNGSQYTGSDGQNNGSQTYGGAGGGGGYWGGEGGNSISGTLTVGSGGGGGGSFLSASFSATSSNGGSAGSASGTSTSTRPSAGNYTDTDNGSTYGGGGNRGASTTSNTGSAGQNGRIVIIYDIKTTPTPAITGTYCAGTTSINGTSAANASVIVTVNGVTQSAVLANASGNWSTTVSALVAGQIITATAQVTSQCISAASSPVTVNPTNTITLSSVVGTNTQTVCTNSAITNITYTTTGATGATFSGLPEGVTGVWNAGFVTISGTPTTSIGSPFSYTVTMTGGCTGGTNTATGTITVNPAATVNAGSATSICSGVSYSLTGSSIGGSASTGTWSITGVTGTMTNGSSQLSSIIATTNPSTVIFTPIPGKSGTVTLTLTTDDPAGSCPSVSSSVILTVSSAPTVSVNNATVCPGATATITATPAQSGGTYTWSTGATTSSITTTPSSTTTYTVTYSLSGCASSAGIGTVTVNPATVSVNSTTVCSGATATITATPSQSGGTYAWSTGATTNSITAAPTSTTPYSVTYSLSGCTPATATGTVTVNPAPTVSVNSATVCSGATVTITATPSQTGGTYAWSTGATTNSITTAPTSTTTYTVTYSLGSCTPSTGNGMVTVSPSITPSLSEPFPICLGETFSALPTTSNEGITGTWSPDLDNTQTTTYTFIPDAGQCAESTTLTLTVNQVSTGTDIITSCTPITWIDGITYAASNNSATFTIVGGAASGCDSLVTLDLTMLPSPASSTTDETICSSQLPYTWNGLTFNAAGSQTATLEGSNGCDSLATLNLTVTPAPTVSVNSATICSGVSTTITATPSQSGGTYLWSTGATTSSILVTPTSSTSYTVTYNLGTCTPATAIGTITVTAPSTPTFTQVGPYLSGASIPALATTSTNGISGTWSPAISNTTTTTYTFTPSAGQCGTTTTMSITINQPLQYTLTANDSTVCAGTTVTLSVNIGSSYPAGTVHCNGTPTAVVDVTNPVTGKTWMDRNLGASQVAANSNDVNAYGDLYQWGRKGDGHQCRNSATTATLSSTDVPGNSSFILVPASPYDWRSPQNANLWQGVNGVNNPCPSGYRIPTETEINTERLSWSQNNKTGAFASPLKLPMGGFRSYNSGSFSGVGSSGVYWSNTISSTFSRLLYFDASSGSMNMNYRANGYSIRCIKD
jgi:uncharacterized protein (TIGR02145 family)